MAVNMIQLSQKVEFVHSVAVSDSNEGYAEVFDYLRRVWSKLEPESVPGSRADLSADSITTSVYDNGNTASVNSAREELTAMQSGSSAGNIDLFGDDDIDDLDMSGAFTTPNSDGLSSMSSDLDNIDDSSDELYDELEAASSNVDTAGLNFGDTPADEEERVEYNFDNPSVDDFLSRL